MHFLSGPVGVEGCEPGDLLVVDLLDVGAKPDSLWGFNVFFSKKNGGGFLTEHFPYHRRATLWLPTDIFEFDVMTNNVGPVKHIKGDIDIPLSEDL